MKIAVIGAGNVGTALAGTAVRSGHEVTVSAAHPEHARVAAQATGATAATTNADAVKRADIVVLAVPAAAYEQLAADLGEALAGKVVVDVANRPTPDPSGAATSIAEELQARLSKAPVVKAFNTLFASRQADPTLNGEPVDGFVAGDDPTAKRTVLDFLASLGFRPVDAGSLASARTLEGMAWLNINRNLQGGTWQDAWVLVAPSNN